MVKQVGVRATSLTGGCFRDNVVLDDHYKDGCCRRTVSFDDEDALRFLMGGYYNGFEVVVQESCMSKQKILLDDIKKIDQVSRLSAAETEISSSSSLSEEEEVPTANTPLGVLAIMFQEALVDSSDEQGGDGLMHTASLLQACWKFESQMRAVGNLAVANDFRQNIKKVEAVYKRTPDDHRKTVAALLAHEKTTGCHGPCGRLKDPSAAMGLLWIRRNLAFQYKIYSNVFERSIAPPEAALAAYHSELEPFFGWALRKIFVLGLRVTVPKSTNAMLAKLAGFQHSTLTEAERTMAKEDLLILLAVLRPIIIKWEEIFLELDLEDRRGA